jgi:DNA-directed RNA polymerase specialized sigma subunit
MSKFEELLADNDVIKVAKCAASSFCNTLSKDEIYTCILNAIWKASERHDPEKGSKFTTYLYNGVIMECLTQQKFNSSKITMPLHNNIPERKNFTDNIELMDNICECDDPNLIIDYYFNNKSIKEIADEMGVSGETIRLKIKKNLKKLQFLMS